MRNYIAKFRRYKARIRATLSKKCAALFGPNAVDIDFLLSAFLTFKQFNSSRLNITRPLQPISEAILDRFINSFAQLRLKASGRRS